MAQQVEESHDIGSMRRQLRQAQGSEPADLVLKNCRVVNVFSREILEADVALTGERICGVGQYRGKEEIDCENMFVAPGFIEGHVHIESSMLGPRQFAAAVIRHGTTSVVCDPHELANVAGMEGVQYFLDQSEGLDVAIYLMAPSCVPATHLETSGAELAAAEIGELLTHHRVLGLAEMMNFPGVVGGVPAVLEKIQAGSGLVIDGHAPGLSGPQLQAYVGCDIGSDHECSTADEAREKLRAGMRIFIREGSSAKNLEDLVGVVNQSTSHRCLLVTDDCHPGELSREGHLDRIVRKAVRLGLDPLIAIQMVTIQVAQYFNIRSKGAVAPGFVGDLVLFDDLEDLRPRWVFAGGRQVVGGSEEDGGGLGKEEAAPVESGHRVLRSVNCRMVKKPFEIKARPGRIRCIGLLEDQLLTEELHLDPTIYDDQVVADPDRDLLKLAVVERHHGSGNVGLGFVRGFGIGRGALASTVGHDSHNIMVMGADDGEMEIALSALIEMNGGLVVVRDQVVTASLPLDIGGLMSSLPVEQVVAQHESLLGAASQLGAAIADPFMMMSFLALPVIPQLKLTDRGLVDVDRFEHVDLWL